mmetsp:Transcript_4441/g.19918  ORF Transcript_4441/g.19918 Transcript_4441/m.19918 type:complete len:220 (-) Transcript_4441:565-1224(-)
MVLPSAAVARLEPAEPEPAGRSLQRVGQVTPQTVHRAHGLLTLLPHAVAEAAEAPGTDSGCGGRGRADETSLGGDVLRRVAKHTADAVVVGLRRRFSRGERTVLLDEVLRALRGCVYHRDVSHGDLSRGFTNKIGPPAHLIRPQPRRFASERFDVLGQRVALVEVGLRAAFVERASHGLGHLFHSSLARIRCGLLRRRVLPNLRRRPRVTLHRGLPARD